MMYPATEFGQAAQVAGMKKRDFAGILGNYGVDYIQYTYDDVVADVERISNRY